MEDKIVLICATGRSGSTTMQRLLNTIPHSNICGENFSAINSLLAFYAKVKYSTLNNIPGKITPFTYDYLVRKNIKPSWYNSYQINEVRQRVRDMIVSMFKLNAETNVWGFKEIRYDNGNIKYIKEFKELFPQTKVIIHIRENIAKQSQSGWFKNDRNAPSFIANTNKELIHFCKENSSYCYMSTFEKMFDRNHLRNIFAFIGCQEHYNEEKITEVLNNNISD
jgi:hypothetical protein